MTNQTDKHLNEDLAEAMGLLVTQGENKTLVSNGFSMWGFDYKSDAVFAEVVEWLVSNKYNLINYNFNNEGFMFCFLKGDGSGSFLAKDKSIRKAAALAYIKTKENEDGEA